MTTNADLLRIKEHSKNEYLKAIQAQPAYQATLQKVKDATPEKSWIQSPFRLPTFSTEDFEEKRKAYIERYGTDYKLPGLDTIIHLKQRPAITNEERAAHNLAKKRGLPSPLSQEQLAELTRRKARYLNMLSSPDSKIQRDITAILTALDNAEDALVTVALLSKTAGHFIPHIKRVTNALGMSSMLGADVINLANVGNWLRFIGTRNKRKLEDIVDKNPFTKKGFAARATRLKQISPTFGELLEVAQTSDQMFGVGISLGSIMGFAQDMFFEGASYANRLAGQIGATIAYPSLTQAIWSDTIKSDALLLAAVPELIQAQFQNILLTAESTLHALVPWWIENDPLKDAAKLGNYIIPNPKPKNNLTRQVLDDAGIDPLAEIAWPMIDNLKPTVQDFLYTYAPRIKDTYLEYSLKNQNTETGFLSGHAVTEIVDNATAAFSDDFQVSHANTAPASMIKDMAQQQLIPSHKTTDAQLQSLMEWGISHERKTGQNPTVNEIKTKGIQLGIEWRRTPPKILNPKLDILYPQWNAIQDQIGPYYEPD